MLRCCLNIPRLNSICQFVYKTPGSHYVSVRRSGLPHYRQPLWNNLDLTLNNTAEGYNHIDNS
jgi:hypothetical protein